MSFTPFPLSIKINRKMIFFQKAAFFAIILATTTRVFGIQSASKDSEFCYDSDECGPESDFWPEECKTGHHQSPIDFEYNPKLIPKKAILDFNGGYVSKNEFYTWNNGHTIQVNLGKEPTSPGRMWGYGMEREYIFAQIHFHWGEDNLNGSEHTVNGQHYPAEVHLVHYDSKYGSFAEAANSGDHKGLAVLAVFLTAGNESLENPAFDEISTFLPLHYKQESEQVPVPLNLNSFLPPEGSTFFRYLGSLTAPNCTEAVEWTVIVEPIAVKLSEIEKFHEVLDQKDSPMRLNYRSVQDLWDRDVEYLVKVKVMDDDDEGHGQGTRNSGHFTLFLVVFSTTFWVTRV